MPMEIGYRSLFRKKDSQAWIGEDLTDGGSTRN